MASIFDNQLLSESDKKRIDELQKAYNQTDDKSLKDEIHKRAESIRYTYGYSGGDDGSRYVPINESVTSAAVSSADYANAQRLAEQNRQSNYQEQKQAVQQAGTDRLRDAYIKNMQDKLGLAQTLKADGISGGVSETTYATIDNNYRILRDDILSDTESAQREIDKSAAQSKYDSDVNIAKNEYEALLDRADRLDAAEKENYQREQDALEWNYRTEQDKYQKEQDKKQWDYQVAKDEKEWNYQLSQDAKEWAQREKEYQLDAQKAAQSASNAQKSSYQKQVSNILTLIKNGYYSPEFAEILGIDGLTKTDNGNDDAKEAAWKLLNKGVYDESFPELLGYTEDVLREYADNVLSGY